MPEEPGKKKPRKKKNIDEIYEKLYPDSNAKQKNQEQKQTHSTDSQKKDSTQERYLVCEVWDAKLLKNATGKKLCAAEEEPCATFIMKATMGIFTRHGRGNTVDGNGTAHD